MERLRFFGDSSDQSRRQSSQYRHSEQMHHNNGISPAVHSPPREMFEHVSARQFSKLKSNRIPHNIVQEYVSLRIPGCLKEKEFNLGTINKVFTATWLTDKQVVFGTKCNKVLVIDTSTKKMTSKPILTSSENSTPAGCPCGIHGLAINPSRNLLATGASNTNDIGVYRLPSFDPVCVGEFGHTDWIFDMKWIDDEYLVTGSRDSNLALWRIQDEGPTEERSYSEVGHPAKRSSSSKLEHPTKGISNSDLEHSGEESSELEYRYIQPTTTHRCEKSDKIRSIAYNTVTKELAAISLNAYLHLWDANTFQQVSDRKLTQRHENVCIAVNEKRKLYAIGSQSNVTLMDPRTKDDVKEIRSKQGNCGIRSVSFHSDVVTMGTGQGAVFFFDSRNCKYVELDCGHACSLHVGDGWLDHDDNYVEYFPDPYYPNAIYTHCYDESGTKLFAAGGPLPAGLYGNYAGLWQ